MENPSTGPATAPVTDTNRIIEERRAKLTAIRAGGTAFPNDFVREHYAGDLTAKHGATDAQALAAAAVNVAVGCCF